jgi:hypothetical protein
MGCLFFVEGQVPTVSGSCKRCIANVVNKSVISFDKNGVTKPMFLPILLPRIPQTLFKE